MNQQSQNTPASYSAANEPFLTVCSQYPNNVVTETNQHFFECTIPNQNELGPKQCLTLLKTEHQFCILETLRIVHFVCFNLGKPLPSSHVAKIPRFCCWCNAGLLHWPCPVCAGERGERCLLHFQVFPMERRGHRVLVTVLKVLYQTHLLCLGSVILNLWKLQKVNFLRIEMK